MRATLVERLRTFTEDDTLIADCGTAAYAFGAHILMGEALNALVANRELIDRIRERHDDESCNCANSDFRPGHADDICVLLALVEARGL